MEPFRKKVGNFRWDKEDLVCAKKASKLIEVAWGTLEEEIKVANARRRRIASRR